MRKLNTMTIPENGKLPYNMTNDYMFRAVLQTNKKVLRGLVGALLHLDPETLEVEIINPIELGHSYDEKDFILDIYVVINGQLQLNLEMQIVNYGNWKERSLSYLCRSFDNICRGENYKSAGPVIHIGFLDFDLFPEAPEFYATYMMKNVNNGIIYTDKLQLSVVELNHIELATEEDRRYGIDTWVTFFKSKTWKELKAMAATNQYMESAVDTIFEVSSNALIREQCRRREDYAVRMKKYEAQGEVIVELRSEIAAKDSEIAAKDSEIAAKDSEIAALKKKLENVGLQQLLTQTENSK